MIYWTMVSIDSAYGAPGWSARGKSTRRSSGVPRCARGSWPSWPESSAAPCRSRL